MPAADTVFLRLMRPTPEVGARVPSRWTTGLAAGAAVTILVIIGVVQQVRLGLDCDVSWLLTVGDRVLDGAQLYRDVIEANPPASVLLYLPAVLAGRATGIGEEAATVVGVFLVAATTVSVAGWALARAGLITLRQMPVITVAAAFVFLILPGACFAQREHVAVLLALPALAVIARRAEALPVPRWAALMAGAAGGLTMAIKPHFMLAFILPIALAAIRRRSMMAVMGPEILASSVVLVTYAITVLLAFPGFIAQIPMLRAAYLPLREDWVTLIRGPVLALPLALAALAGWVRGWRIGIVAAVLAAAAAGFAIAALVQGKGYINHAYPAAALGFLALAAVLSGAGPFRHSRVGAVLATLLLAGLEWHAFGGIASHPRLAEAVRRLAPPHPRMIALSTEIGLGHPVVRQIGGIWVGRSGALWAAGGAHARLATVGLSASERETLTAIEAADVAGFVSDVRAGRPDVILLDGTLGHWPRSAGLRAVMSEYRPAATVEGVALWTRRLPDSRSSR